MPMLTGQSKNIEIETHTPLINKNLYLRLVIVQAFLTDLLVREGFFAQLTKTSIILTRSRRHH